MVIHPMARSVLYAAIAAGLLGVVVFAFRAGWLAPSQSLKSDIANPTVAGLLVSVQDNNVTLSLAGGRTTTYTLAPEAKVISQVKTGEVGKTLAEFPSGSQVFVQPRSSGSSVIDSITLAPRAIESNNSLGAPLVASGAVVIVKNTAITLHDASGQEMTFAITEDTAVVANVLAGKPGKTIDYIHQSSFVQVSGYSGTDGLVAEIVQVFDIIQ